MTMLVEQSNTPISGSLLETRLLQGEFVFTAEMAPPDSALEEDVILAAEPLKDVVHAINATDAAGANCHMSSLGVCAILARNNVDPVFQITCRDRNRIAIQGDVLGAAAMGIKNVLCLSGDDVSSGDQPGARPVFDLDALSLLQTLCLMRDKGQFLSGRPITSPPKLFLGACENPSAPPINWRPDRMAKKIRAGAQFIQTNFVFDVDRFRAFMVRAMDEGLTDQAYVIAGIGPILSARSARWMQKNIPGIFIPDHIIERLEKSADPNTEGLKICVEQMQEIATIPGVSGLHIMAHKREREIAGLIAKSGL